MFDSVCVHLKSLLLPKCYVERSTDNEKHKLNPYGKNVEIIVHIITINQYKSMHCMNLKWKTYKRYNFRVPIAKRAMKMR